MMRTPLQQHTSRCSPAQSSPPPLPCSLSLSVGALAAGCDKQHLARAKNSNASRCRDQVSRQERSAARRRWRRRRRREVNSREQEEEKNGISQLLLLRHGKQEVYSKLFIYLQFFPKGRRKKVTDAAQMWRDGPTGAKSRHRRRHSRRRCSCCTSRARRPTVVWTRMSQRRRVSKQTAH